MKRKAAEYEETSLSPRTPPGPPSLVSSQGSSSSIAGLPTEENDSRPYNINLRNIAGAPYFNSRTRKRFRDGRSDEETIHQSTLKKLYDAQRLQQIGIVGVEEGTRPTVSPATSPDTPVHLRYYATASQIHGPLNMVHVPIERSQRSIDAFFRGRSSRAETPEPIQINAMQPPLMSSVYQPEEHAQTLVRPHSSKLPSVLTCEGCDAPLLTKMTGEIIDAEMLDVDGTLVDPEVSEGWSCSLCRKRVCDTCAVRGNYRVCLECAVPGGGKYQPEELIEKRWVGGIGWM